jgi:hypothetical protein
MKYFLDTEFIEKPCTIDLISIGIVAEDGREYYAISMEFDRSQASEWVEKNVISLLPPIEDPAWKNRIQIQKEILDFVGDGLDPEFWGYYADYDWVAFCWLFGPMIDLPKHFPKFCRDLKQVLVQHGIVRNPITWEYEHNALADARWVKKSYEWLERYLLSQNL